MARTKNVPRLRREGTKKARERKARENVNESAHLIGSKHNFHWRFRKSDGLDLVALFTSASAVGPLKGRPLSHDVVVHILDELAVVFGPRMVAGGGGARRRLRGRPAAPALRPAQADAHAALKIGQVSIEASHRATFDAPNGTGRATLAYDAETLPNSRAAAAQLNSDERLCRFGAVTVTVGWYCASDFALWYVMRWACLLRVGFRRCSCEVGEMRSWRHVAIFLWTCTFENLSDFANVKLFSLSWVKMC